MKCATRDSVNVSPTVRIRELSAYPGGQTRFGWGPFADRHRTFREAGESTEIHDPAGRREALGQLRNGVDVRREALDRRRPLQFV